jgi:hypothetical protein
MNRASLRRLLRILPVFTGSLAFLLLGFLLFDDFWAATPGFIGSVLREVVAVGRDSSTQWMLVFCLAIYFIMFLILERRLGSMAHRVGKTLTSPHPSPLPAGAERGCLASFRGNLSNPDLWLAALVGLVLGRYALAYSTATHSVQIPVLLAGLVFGKAMAMWVRYLTKNPHPQPLSQPLGEGGVGLSPSAAERERERRIHGIIFILLALLAAAAWWQPQNSMRYEYHGVTRWSGIWDNPNLYGLLMGVGVVLATGMGVRSWELGAGRRRKMFWVVFCLFAAVLCGIGLFKSYSRGAWLATAVGVGYLMWRYAHLTPSLNIGHLIRPAATFSPSDAEKDAQGGEGGFISCGSWFHRNRLPLAVVMLSVVVLLFWQFRYSEFRPAQRVFSAANANDFSWRNRVTAWAGAARMMVDRPWTGFGWGQAEADYNKKYLSSRLNEGAAIEMNDYLMIGISAGVPALFCFAAYIWLSLRPRSASPPYEPRSAGVSPAGWPGVSPGDGTGGETPPALAAGDGRATLASVQEFKAQNSSSRNSHPDPLLSLRERRGDVQATCRAGAIVLLVGFWFDGGLFKLPVTTVFWTLMELARLESPVGDEVASHPSKLENQLETPYIVSYAKKGIWLRWLAGILAGLAAAQTTVYWGTPWLPVSDGTLAVAQKCLIQRSEAGDFEFLSTNAVWRGVKLKVLLEHVRLAHYNRQLINWKLDDTIYQEFVLSPVITGDANEQLDWRRPLWEEFYLRIRHESSPEDAAKVVLKHLHERVTIAALPNPARDVPDIWRKQTTDEAGFEIVQVAALRSVGVPARLDSNDQTEYWNGSKWQTAPLPSVTTWQQ